MKQIEFHPDVTKKIATIRKRDTKLYKKIKKQLTLFQQDPRHVSLRTHKLSGNLKNLWSISIDRNMRMLYVDIDTYFFTHIGTHDEVYK